MKAAKYKSLASAARVVYDVPLPTTTPDTVKLRDPLAQQWIMAGHLPEELTGRVLAAENDPETFEQNISPEDANAMRLFFRDLIIDCLVEPRVSLNPGPDEIAFEDLAPADFQFLMNWVKTGGMSGSRLATFPVEAAKPAVARNNRKK